MGQEAILLRMGLVVRDKQVFRGLTGSQRTPRVWGVTMALAKVAKEALLARLVKELGIQQGGVQLHCDNQGVNLFGKEPGV